MSRSLIVVLSVIAVAMGVLIFSAIGESRREIVTVSKLVTAGTKKNRIQLGARVADLPFEYQTEPELRLKFSVRDIKDPSSAVIPVIFNGPMPETLRAGRDVILEGGFDGTVFLATQLQTQCPSKYEPPKGPNR